MSTSILGNRVVRVEDPQMMTSGGTYVADIDLPDAGHCVFVRSTAAAGTILSVETEKAAASPGVLGVFTAADLDLNPVSGRPGGTMVRYPLTSDRVTFAGEPVAVVVAETYAQALDAAEAVVVDIDYADAVTSIRQALTDTILVHPVVGTNVLAEGSGEKLDLSECDVVVELEITNNRMNAAPLEPRVAAARWEDGLLTCWTSTQGPHVAQSRIAKALGLEASTIRVITPDVGGAFGSKAAPGAEEVTLGALSKALRRPVVWAESRTENFLAMGNGRSQLNQVRLGGTADGRLTHYEITIGQEAGAYLGAASFMPTLTAMMATGVYDIENAAASYKAVATNTPPVVPYRGAGRPEATAALERAVDVFAQESGLDPAELRLNNMIDPDSFPFESRLGALYDSGDYPAALELALANANYAELRKEQQRRIDRGDSILLGIGIASYVEVTARAAAVSDEEFGAIEIGKDGCIVARTGATAFGQGHETSFAMVVADRLGVTLDQVTVISGDTHEIPSSQVTGGSRSMQLAASNLADSADRLIELGKDQAADMLEAARADIIFANDRGEFHVAGTPAKAVDWSAVAAEFEGLLIGVGEFAQTGATYPFGTHIAVVEVDVETGKVEVMRLVTADDAGTLINPLLAEGQIHGGLASGIGQALFEEMTYDEFGNLTSSNYADYAMPGPTELPNFEVSFTQTPTPHNPLGAKGIGESGSVGSTPAVHNAVIDALGHLGITHIELPLTPLRVWKAYENAVAGSPE